MPSPRELFVNEVRDKDAEWRIDCIHGHIGLHEDWDRIRKLADARKIISAFSNQTVYRIVRYLPEEVVVARCAAIICKGCLDSISWFPAQFNPNARNRKIDCWEHTSKVEMQYTMHCRAARLWHSFFRLQEGQKTTIIDGQVVPITS